VSFACWGGLFSCFDWVLVMAAFFSEAMICRFTVFVIELPSDGLFVGWLGSYKTRQNIQTFVYIYFCALWVLDHFHWALAYLEEILNRFRKEDLKIFRVCWYSRIDNVCDRNDFPLLFSRVKSLWCKCFHSDNKKKTGTNLFSISFLYLLTT